MADTVIAIWQLQRHRQSLWLPSSSFRRRQHAPSDQFRFTRWRYGSRRHSRRAAGSVRRDTASPRRNVRSSLARRRSVTQTIARQRYSSCLVAGAAFPRLGGYSSACLQRRRVPVRRSRPHRRQEVTGHRCVRLLPSFQRDNLLQHWLCIKTVICIFCPLKLLTIVVVGVFIVN